MKAPKTLMWNKAKNLLVAVGDSRGRFFYCAEGAEIPDDAPLDESLKVMSKPADKMERAPYRKAASIETKEE